jgi:hypothetical protein
MAIDTRKLGEKIARLAWERGHSNLRTIAVGVFTSALPMFEVRTPASSRGKRHTWRPAR